MLYTLSFIGGGMEKDLSVSELFEIYKDLLTEKQRGLFSSYYLYDLSLSEIAESEGTSRQSVFDGIKKAKNQLQEYESVLGLHGKNEKFFELAENIRQGKIADGETIANLIVGIIESEGK